MLNDLAENSQILLSPSHHNYQCNLLHLWIRASAKCNQLWFFWAFLTMLMYLYYKQTFALPVTPPLGLVPLLTPQNRPSQSGSVELWAAVSHVGFVYMRLAWTHWFIPHCNLIRGWMLMAQTSFQNTVFPPPLCTRLSFSDLSRAFCK